MAVGYLDTDDEPADTEFEVILAEDATNTTTGVQLPFN